MKKFYFLLIALLCSAIVVFAYDVKIDGIYYNLNYETKTAEVTNDGDIWDDDGAGYIQSKIIMPSKITYNENDYGVTSISSYAFYNCSSLISIIIPNDVIFIGEGAFISCSFLDTLICEFSNDISFEFFDEYSGEGIEIHPIDGVKNLRYLQGPSKLINSIGEEFLPKFSNKLTEIHITDGEVDDSGFNFINRSKKTLHTIDLAGTINTTINDLAFYDCYKLENLILPSNLETIGFKAVAECLSLKSIVIPTSVIEIADAAFYNCHSINSIVFAENGVLAKIGSWAFHNNYALKSVEIPEGVEEIGDATFYGCTYLENIILPSTIQSVGDNAFALCNRVKRMEVKAVIPPEIEAKTFYEVSREIEFIVPIEARKVYAEHKYWKEFVKGTPVNVENVIEGVEIYCIDGELRIDGLNEDYQVYNISSRLVYTGRDAQLQLPRGVYVVNVGGEVQKVVI